MYLLNAKRNKDLEKFKSEQDTKMFARGIICCQISELQKSILNLRLDLNEFEQKY